MKAGRTTAKQAAAAGPAKTATRAPAPQFVPDPTGLLDLQRHAGNRAVRALLDGASSGDNRVARLHEHAPIAARIRLRTPPTPQAKLAIGPVNDAFEQEADRFADAVMRMATPPAADDGQAIRSAGPRIQRKCAACGAEGDEPCTCAQRKAESAPTAAPRDAPRSVAAALAGPARQLDSPTRAFFESRLGVDLGTVRIHDHPRAAASAQELAARAYTVGSDIVFAAGRYQPATTAGRELLAHELAHVFQQQHRPHAVQRDAEPHAAQRRAGSAADPRIVVTPTKGGVNITITADTKLEGIEVYVLTVMYGKDVSRERAVKLIDSGETVGCVHPVCKTGMQPGETIDLFFGPDYRAQEEHVQAPKRKLPPEVQNALESGYMRHFMRDRQTQKHLELPAQPDFSEDRAVIMARNALLAFSRDDIKCFWRWVPDAKIEGWWKLAYRLGQFLEVRPNVCAPVNPPLGRLIGHEDTYALIKETEKLEQQTYTPAGQHDVALHEKLAAARAARDKALHNADFSDVGAFDQAANEFRVYFRGVAVAALQHSLDQSERVLQDAVGRYQVGSNPNTGDQINPVAQQLYDELYRLPRSQARSPDQLKIDHPILQGRTIGDTIGRAKDVLDFSNRLTRYALERLNDLKMVRNALGRSEDVVFKFEPIVTATMERVGAAPGSIFASVIDDQRGKPGEPWWQQVLEVGLLLLSFVPGPIGFAARTVNMIRDVGGAGIEYNKQFSAFELGLQDKPSVAPIAMAVAANVGPHAGAAVIGKGYHAVKAMRAASKLETAAARTAATDIVKTGAGDVARTEGDVLATDLARTEGGEAAKDVAATTEPGIARPPTNVEPPVTPKSELAPVATGDTAPVPVAQAPSAVQPDPRLAQAEGRVATSQGKAEAARARLEAARQTAAQADEAGRLAEAELDAARQEAKVARAERARAEKAYQRAKPGSRAAPRAEYTAAKNAAEKAERKVASASKRAKSAKKARGDAAKAVPRQEAIVGRAEQAVGAAEEQRLIEIEADRVRKLPPNIEGLRPSWDYERFPNGPHRAWQPGDAINMPDAKGNYPVWDTIRKRLNINRATDELGGRAAGTRVRARIPPKPKARLDPTPAGWEPWGATEEELAAKGWQKVPAGGLPWLDPIAEASDKELAAIASSGRMPGYLGAEIEHARIPQRAGEMLEAAGVEPNTARRVTKLGDPDNLMPTRKEIHAIVDEPARVINPNRNPTLQFSLDVRAAAPFREATDEEIAEIVQAIKNRGIAVPETEAQKVIADLETRMREAAADLDFEEAARLRDEVKRLKALERLRGFLTEEKKLRPLSTWEVP